MLALNSLVSFKPNLYCETNFNNKKYEFFLDFLTIIVKIQYLFFNLLKARDWRKCLKAGDSISNFSISLIIENSTDKVVHV